MRHPIVEEDLAAIADSDLPWDELAGRTVLVTGANGFLPAYMVETVLFLNERRRRNATQVIGLVRNIDKARARFAGYQNRSDLRFLTQDVALPVTTDSPVDFIVHAASQASPKYFGRDPVGTLQANVLGTHNLLSLAKIKRTHGFLFFSSSEVYGQVLPEQNPIRETDGGFVDPTRVRSCYAESKRMGETMCVSWTHQYGLRTLLARPFHTYGPGMDLEDGRVFADFVANIVHDQDIVIRGHGSAIRTFCYLADAVAGFFTVLLKGESGQAYNIGNPGAELSVLDLAQLITGLFPEKKLHVIHRPVPAEPRGYLTSPNARICPDIGKARGLGWQARTPASTGFLRTVRSYS